MTSHVLKLGGRSVTMTKSDTYIGVKPRSGADRGLLAASAQHQSAAPVDAPSLGGFELWRVGTEARVEDDLNQLRANPLVMAGTHVFHTSADNVPFVPTGQIYVEFAPAAQPKDIEHLLDVHALQVVEAKDERCLVVRITPDSTNPIKVSAALQDSPFVDLAEPDLATPGELQAAIVPHDPRLVDQWHLRNTGFHRSTKLGFKSGADARVVEAWEHAQSLGSPGVVVAVIDDGFDLGHPDLTGDWKIVAPKDFTRNSAQPTPDPLSEDWHGTACAGVAVGNADGTGIAGAAPRSRLMPIRWGRFLSDGQIESWFDYVREQGAWVVSCSWSAAAAVFPLSTRASRAIARCAKEGRDGLGCVICFAAGNESRDIEAPDGSSLNGFAAHPDVVAVAASNSRDERSSYSNFGQRISVCAPSSGAGGWGITTSDVMGQYARGGETFEAGYSPGAYTDDFGGTSSAAPLVAGICALILALKPTLASREVKELIETTARRIGDPHSYVSGHSPHFGHGCVDARAAIAKLLPKKKRAAGAKSQPPAGQVGLTVAHGNHGANEGQGR